MTAADESRGLDVGEPRWARRTDVLWRRTPDAVVLLAAVADDGDPLVITGGGPAVWDLLEVPMTFDQLVEALTGLFMADRDTIVGDLATLLDDLDRRNLVQRLEP